MKNRNFPLGFIFPFWQSGRVNFRDNYLNNILKACFIYSLLVHFSKQSFCEIALYLRYSPFVSPHFSFLKYL